MRDVKRIEIVINTPHAPRVRQVLDELGVPGLTIFETLAGYGDRGDREGGELSDAAANLYLLTTCRPDQVPALAAALEPILRRYGGLCLISDATVIRNGA